MFTVAAGRIIQFALLLLTLRLATTFLSPEEMGKVAIVTTTVAFFALLLLNPVGMFMNRRLHAWDAKGLVKDYLGYFWLYLLVVNSLAALTLIAITSLGFWKPSIEIGWLLLLVCGNLFFGTLNQVVIPGLNLLGHRVWFTVLTVATAAVSLMLAVVLVYQQIANAEFWLMGLLGGQLFVGLIGKHIFFRSLQHPVAQSSAKVKLSSSHLLGLLHFTWPIAIAVGLGWIQAQSYRFMMESTLGLYELGLFVAGYGISAGLIAAFESVFTTYLQPIFYKKISENDVSKQSAAWCDYASAILPSLFLVGFFIVAVTPELTGLMLGAAYQDSSRYVIWGVIAELARVITGVYGMIAHARMKTKSLVVPNLIGALASIALLLWLTPLYGAIGVGVALAFSAGLVSIATYLTLRNTLSTHFPLQPLLVSLSFGGGVLGFAYLSKQLIYQNGSLFESLVQLLIVGGAFVLFQFYLLHRVLPKKIST